jgi:DedD protein
VEQLVKERLVGAAVLLAAAVILIPEMLSGPKHEQSAQSAAAVEDAPTKTYTIDLAQPAQRQPQSQPGIETTAAPPSEALTTEPVAATPPSQATPESPVKQSERHDASRDQSRREPTADQPAATPPAESRRAAAVETPSKRDEQSVPVVKPAPLATARSVPTSKGWAVQLGSFSKEDTAERLAQEARAHGHNAFVMPVKSGSGTLYRVRVGPLPDRAQADALQRELKTANPGATVVAHP